MSQLGLRPSLVCPTSTLVLLSTRRCCGMARPSLSCSSPHLCQGRQQLYPDPTAAPSTCPNPCLRHHGSTLWLMWTSWYQNLAGHVLSPTLCSIMLWAKVCLVQTFRSQSHTCIKVSCPCSWESPEIRASPTLMLVLFMGVP